jgi:hypothetical protein
MIRIDDTSALSCKMFAVDRAFCTDMIPDMLTNAVSGSKSHANSLARKLPSITKSCPSNSHQLISQNAAGFHLSRRRSRLVNR